jgi:hypothetical protein
MSKRFYNKTFQNWLHVPLLDQVDRYDRADILLTNP